MIWRNPACTLCPHHREANEVCMVGSGPIPAKIMVVGEAPGYQEDEQGEPFVGPSGAYLDTMLALAGIDRAECYVTNVVKCHPIDNETPTRGEVKTCVTAYMGEELLEVQPQFILLLGNAALQGVAGKSGITKHRGVVWDARGAKIFATFHPAAVLRNPRYRALVATDFQRFGRLVRGERSVTPETKVSIVRTKAHLKWLVDKILEADELAYDVETYCDHPMGTNFQEYRGDHSMIVSIAFTWQEGQAAVVPLSHAETPWKDVARVQRIIGQAIAQSRARMVAHNGLYDAKWMGAKDMTIHQDADTMLMCHIIDENRPKGLKPLSQILLGADSYDVGDELHDAFHMPVKRLCLYNGKDTDYTLRIYHAQRTELLTEPRTARVYQKLMMPASNALVTIQANGIQLDMERWGQRFDKASGNVERVRQYMLQFVPKAKRDTINFNSPMQVGAWLFEDLDLPVIERTAKGATSSKESVLLQLAHEHKAAAALLKYRKWSKYLSTYLLPWRDFRDARNRIHPNYKLFGTVTGRLSCVSADTLIDMPRDMTLYPEGIPITQVKRGDWVYSFDFQRELTLRQVKRVWKTGDRFTVIITVENSIGHRRQLRCTPDHLIRLRNGDWRYAWSFVNNQGKNRGGGTRVMTMVRRSVDNDRISFAPHSIARGNGMTSGGRNKEHRWIAAQLRGKSVSTKTDVHHIDENKFNNRPDNLRVLSIQEHRSNRKLHPKWGEENHEAPDIYQGPNDYYVISVESGEVEPVWDMEVEEDHQFIANGIVVHNCVDPNLQQVPRDPFIRGVLGARPGWSLVVADYSQVELRIAAMMADEPTMLGQFARGEDIHMLRAMRMTGKPASEVTKEERKHAKPVSFGFLYGMGAPKFIEYARDSYEVIFNEDQAEAVRRGFFTDYPQLLTWHDRQRRLARKYGRVTSPIGRTRHLPDITSKDRGVQGEAERQAINSPVQSLASDLMLLAMIELQRSLDPAQAIIVGTVHDSILFEVKDGWTTFAANEIKSTMEDMSIVKRKFGTEITVPIVADVEISKHWSDQS